MSRRWASTRRRGAWSGTGSRCSRPRPARRSSSRPTTWRRPSVSANALRSWTWARSPRTARRTSCGGSSTWPRSKTPLPRQPAVGSRKEGASGMSARAESAPAVWLEFADRAGRLRDGTVAMGWAELRKLRHDHLDIFTRSVQPLLWLFIFGTALRRNHTLSGGFHDYRAYLAPGVMAQAALFVAIF